MFKKIESFFNSLTPKTQDQLYGLLIIIFISLIVYSLGYSQGYADGQVKQNFEDPTSVSMDNHIKKLLEEFECPKPR